MNINPVKNPVSPFVFVYEFSEQGGLPFLFWSGSLKDFDVNDRTPNRVVVDWKGNRIDRL